MPDDTEAGVVARGVRRSFGQVEALRGLDLTAPYGDVTALVGPNGSGKTTLFLALATLLVPDAGEIEVAGFDPRAHPDGVRANLGWMPDMFGVYDQLTAREYLTFFARAYRLPGATVPQRVSDLLARVHLEEYAHSPVRVLSRGQKQRLGVARALVHQPSVLLLDEPASGLDPRSRIELRELLRALAREGAAVLVSSHILAELEEIADGVVVVDHGATVGAYRPGESPPPVGAATPHPAGWEAAGHGQTWRLRALDQAGLLSALEARGVDVGASGPGGADVRLGSEGEAADLLAGLIADGVRVVSYAPEMSDIEARYLELTTQERR